MMSQWIKKNLLQLKEDGFNAIIVSMPWGEFQPYIEPISYNQDALQRLGNLCMLSKSLDIRFFIRVSYLWDYMPKVQYPTTERFYKLYNDQKTINAWADYLKKINEVTQNCADTSFISWEDYWNIIDNFKKANDKITSATLSRDSGFSDWISKEKKEYAQSHQEELKEHGVYLIPDKSTTDFSLVYEWFDDFISHKLMPVMAHTFKSASLEARVDDDPIYEGEKISSWYSHQKTYSVPSSEYLFTYWSLAQGAQNEGEKITPKQAIGTFDFMSNKIHTVTKNKLIIGQFLFLDNTPLASRNASLNEVDIPKFLENISSNLQEKYSGYALWTYRDYRANLLYNSNFSLGCDGWFCKKTSLKIADRKKVILINKGSFIEQTISSERNHFGYSGAITRVDINTSGNGDILVAVGDSKKIVSVKSDDVIKLIFPVIDGSVSFSVNGLSGQVMIKDINLYNFEQKSDVRYHNNSGSVFLNSFRQINSQM